MGLRVIVQFHNSWRWPLKDGAIIEVWDDQTSTEVARLPASLVIEHLTQIVTQAQLLRATAAHVAPNRPGRAAPSFPVGRLQLRPDLPAPRLLGRLGRHLRGYPHAT